MNPTDRSLALLREATDPERGLVRDLLARNDLALVHVDLVVDRAPIVVDGRCSTCGSVFELRGDPTSIVRILGEWLAAHDHPNPVEASIEKASRRDDEEPF